MKELELIFQILGGNPRGSAGDCCAQEGATAKKREQMKPYPARVTLTLALPFSRFPSLFYSFEIDRHFISLAADYPNILGPDRQGDEKSDYSF